EQSAQGSLATRHALDEQPGVGDPVPGIGVDHQALLVAGDDLELFGLVVEQPAVDPHHVLDQRDLGVESGFGLGLADDGAELAHQDLLGRIDRVESLRQHEDDDGGNHQRNDGTVAHREPPVDVDGGGGGGGVRGSPFGYWFGFSSGS